MRVIENASKVAVENRGRRKSAQAVKLLNLKPDQGFTTLKKKVPGLRVVAQQNGITIKTSSRPGGSVLIYRPAN